MPVSPVSIKYDGKAPWGEAVPYIQIDRQPLFFGGKWGQVMNVTLNGQISLGLNAQCWLCNPGGQYILAPDAPTALIFCQAVDVANNAAAPEPDQTNCLNGGNWGNVSNYPVGVKILETARDGIIDVFRKNLKTFEFEDSETPPNKMSFPNTVVESIEFPESGYHGFLDFAIRLRCYEQDFFIAQGIVDPTDEFQLTEGEDGSMSVTHTVSARGVDFTQGASATNPGQLENGLDNAITWVNSRLGEGNMSDEGAVKAWDCGTGVGKLYLVLLNQNEKINRMEGQYSITETFIAYLDEDSAVEGLKAVSKYSVEMSQSLNDDFRNVTINGTIKGGKNTTMGELRAAVIKNDAYDMSVIPPAPVAGKKGLYEKAKEISGMDGSDVEHPLLQRIPVSYSLDESIEEKQINVKAKFDTNPLFVDENGDESRHYFDYTVEVSTDEITQISKISIKGTLKVRGLITERKCYIQDFLDNTDLMDFLAKKAKAEYDVIMKVCHKCSGQDPNSDPPNEVTTFYAKAQPYQSGQEACAHWSPYQNATAVGDPASLCWKLNECAESLSVTRNESSGQLNLAATFNDSDFLNVFGSGAADVCWECVDDGTPQAVYISGTAASAKSYCEGEFPYPEGDITVVEVSEGFCGGTDNPTGCYDKASYNVLVNNPVNFVKVNASGQKENEENSYNGHWAIQKFGIQTRAKSTTKVNLTMRQDALVIDAAMENELRIKANEIQEILNAALKQEGTALDYEGNPQVAALGTPDGPYDINKNVSHRESAAQSISVSLERSYIPEDDASFCVEIPEPEKQKACWDCLTAAGVTRGEVYAYQTDEEAENGTIPEEAYEKCDQLATDLGLVVTTTTAAPSGGGATTTTTAPAAGETHVLTPSPCKNCYTCYGSSLVELGDVQAVDITAASTACMNEHGAADHVYPCEYILEKKCYNCVADDGTVVVPDFDALTPEDAQQVCENSGEESVAEECPSPPADCYACMNMGEDPPTGYTYVYAASEEQATNECTEEGSTAGISLFDIAVVPCGETADLKCWKCEDESIVYAFTETSAKTQCPNDALMEGTQPVPCP
ncbi:hypothetical protein CMI37_37855 [Candidatus Pacearchaeota archaeon]|nr:hypothetical protein [Candidatus Pacearchaeota archaeon]